MRVWPTIAFAYCLLATVVLTGYLVLSVVRMNDVAAGQALQQESLLVLVAAEEHDRQAYNELKESQREGRAGYDGPEAVDASYGVQAAHDAYLQSQRELAAAQSRLAVLQAEHDRRSIGLVPIIVLLLVHLAGVLGAIPFRRTPTASRR